MKRNITDPNDKVDKQQIKLPREYAKLKDTDFPVTINGIKYKTKQELADRYNADLMAFANLIYDIYQNDKEKRRGQHNG